MNSKSGRKCWGCGAHIAASKASAVCLILYILWACPVFLLRNLTNCTVGMYLFDESSDSYEKFGDIGIFQVVDSHAEIWQFSACVLLKSQFKWERWSRFTRDFSEPNIESWMSMSRDKLHPFVLHRYMYRTLETGTVLQYMGNCRILLRPFQLICSRKAIN